MNTSVFCPRNKYIELPCIRRVAPAVTLTWLARGWQDFQRAWAVSLALGAVIGGLGLAVIYLVSDRLYLTMALAGGYLVIAPVLAAGFYQISRQLEWQDTGQIGSRPGMVRLVGTNTALFGLLLAVVFAIWIDLALIATALVSARELAMADSFSLLNLFSLDNLPYGLAFFAIGALVAATVFTFSVVTLPMLMDRQVDLATAMMTSWVVVKENPAAMAAWAGLIVALMAIGMATLFIGFAVLFPVLGHATWHAYRGLVERI